MASSLSGLFKRATSYLGLDPHSPAPTRPPPADGEIVFSKNNVCVHPTATLRVSAHHNPGYLTLRYREARQDVAAGRGGDGDDAVEASTIFLTWIPNSALRDNPAISDPRVEHSPRTARLKRAVSAPSGRMAKTTTKNGETTMPRLAEENSTPTSVASTPPSDSPDSGIHASAEKPDFRRKASVADLVDAFERVGGVEGAANVVRGVACNGATSMGQSPSLKTRQRRKSDLENDEEEEGEEAREVEDDADSDSTEGADSPASSTLASPLRFVGAYSLSDPPILYSAATTPSPSSSPPRNDSPAKPDFLDCNPETVAANRNLNFPDTSAAGAANVNVERLKHLSEGQLGIFSVDLANMRYLRLFFTDDSKSSGQLIIASRESQYKIFHFHHGGLDKLVDVFRGLDLFAPDEDVDDVRNVFSCKMLAVHSSSSLPSEECHPEERKYDVVDQETWKSHIDDDGSVRDNYELRKAIFFGGLDPSLRQDVWPFLLHYYDWCWSSEERQRHRERRAREYEEIRRRREDMTREEKTSFWRSVQCTVEKDVVRTDRSHPYFAGARNPNVATMKHILLDFAFHCPKVGYNQGMSDLLAPIMVQVRNEADAFWCFVGLMNDTIFVSSPRDNDIEKQLGYLRALLRVLTPTFHAHLASFGDAMELLFCHRWILLCFKREFPERETLAIWEACWAQWKTDYFHLFVCVAIVALYGDDIVSQNMRSDETLFYFSTLAMHMNGTLVLRKARGLLHRFRILPRIPCTLVGLCELCSPGQWDSGHVPTVECEGGHEEGKECGYGGGGGVGKPVENGSGKGRGGGGGGGGAAELRKMISLPGFKWGEKSK